MGGLKADSHIACRAHAVPLLCRAAKGLECVFPIWFTQCGRVWFTLAIPCPFHAPTMPFFSRPQHITAVERRFRMRLSHLIYTVRPCLIHTCHAMPIPCSDHAVLLKATAQHGCLTPCCAVALRRTAWSEHGKGMTWQVWIRHGRTV